MDNNGTPGVPRVVLTHGYDAYNNRTSRSDNAERASDLYCRPLRG